MFESPDHQVNLIGRKPPPLPVRTVLHGILLLNNYSSVGKRYDFIFPAIIVKLASTWYFNYIINLSPIKPHNNMKKWLEGAALGTPARSYAPRTL